VITTAHGFQLIFAPTRVERGDAMSCATPARVMFFDVLIIERALAVWLGFDVG
jgi:hypothetical protein